MVINTRFSVGDHVIYRDGMEIYEVKIEIYNELVPQVEPLSEEGEPIVYPYPLLDNQMVEALLETSEWSNIDE